MEKIQKNRIIGFSCILISAFFTGFAPAVTQKAFEYGLSVETILNTRFFTGAILVWAFIALRRSNINVGKKNLVLLISVGIFGVIAAILLNESYKYLPAAIASILVFTYVIMVNLIDMLRGREKLTAGRFVCLIMAIVGLVAVIWTPGEGITFHILGITLAIISAFFYALNSLALGAKRFHNINSEVISGYTIIIPVIVNFVRCVGANEPLFPSEPNQWACTLFLGIGAIGIASILYIFAIKKIGVSDTAITNTLEPVFAYIAGIILMGDVIASKSIMGGLIILGAIALLNYLNKKQLI